MCGIGGIVRYDGRHVHPESLAAMSNSLAHRGPDDQGFLVWNGENALVHEKHTELSGGKAGLIHRRLAILDLSRAGRQPMSTPDGRFHIAYNGEIYNYVELRERLKRKGYTFATHTDTEVLLHAFAEWGHNCLNELVGMFAFAILDTRKRTLFLARDFFGIKPLYIASTREFFAFSSEIKGLMSLGCIPAAADAQAVYDYLQHGRILDSVRTVYSGITHLPPAHCLEVDLDSPGMHQPERYWEIETGRTLDITFDEAANETRRLFLENVRLHLRSDVPVGVALSGGVDSSSIAAGMRLHSKNLDIHGFSFTPDDPAISEEPFVDIVGRASSITVHKVRIGPDDLLADIGRLLAVHDEPFLNTGMYAQYRVMKAASESGIKVMLDGQGADEMLGGYVRYYGDTAASLLASRHPLRAARLLWDTRTLRGVTPATLLAPIMLRFLPRRGLGLLRSAMGKGTTHPWLDERWFLDRGVKTDPTPPQRSGRHLLRQELKRSLEHDLPQLLRYEDRNSMAHSIESRVPFLTPSLAEFLFSLPEHFLISPRGITKHVFRKSMRGIVSDAVLDRKDKFGFPTPEHVWLEAMRPWLKDSLESATALGIPFFRHRQIADEWGAAISPGSFGASTWRFMSIAKWFEVNEISL